MNEIATKPYLLRALYEWCVDNGYTPHVAVKVDSKTQVPSEYVKNGEITLNVSPSAVHKLQMGNELIEFSARFAGVARQISVPVGNVYAIYARETGHGMTFDVDAAKPATQAVAEAEPAGRRGSRRRRCPRRPTQLTRAAHQARRRQAQAAAAAGQMKIGVRPRFPCEWKLGSDPWAGLAQLVEQRFCKPLVGGSIPSAGTSPST